MRGSMIAAIVLTALPEIFRELNDYRMLFYAIILILMMLAKNNETLAQYIDRYMEKTKNWFRSFASRISMGQKKGGAN